MQSYVYKLFMIFIKLNSLSSTSSQLSCNWLQTSMIGATLEDINDGVMDSILLSSKICLLKSQYPL